LYIFNTLTFYLDTPEVYLKMAALQLNATVETFADATIGNKLGYYELVKEYTILDKKDRAIKAAEEKAANAPKTRNMNTKTKVSNTKITSDVSSTKYLIFSIK
jgi:hypothetical protein